jgi:hypothetical protein
MLAETYSVAERIYQQTKLDRPEERAMGLLEWLYTSPNFWIAEQSLQLAVLSGKIKSRFAVATCTMERLSFGNASAKS